MRSLVLLVGLLWGGMLLADYTVVLRSGLVFRCEAKPVAKDGMVEMQVIDGPFMRLPEKDIDWDETRFRNHEIPKRNTKNGRQAGGSAIERIHQDFKTLQSAKFSRESILAVSWLLSIIIAFLSILAFVWNSFVYWFILRMIGEPLPFFPWLFWNFIITAITFVSVVGMAFFLDPLIWSWVGRGIYFLLLVWVVTVRLDGELINVLLANALFMGFNLLQVFLVTTYLLDLSNPLF
ncbi:MAG: hypothetical protein KDC71_01750 [Acidobacteria bacterium]|nr:hypothetical protein [Acidobacteriota bacterium]